MSESIFVLLGTAVFLGVTHTIVGPDHYLPFIVLSRSEKWSLKKTLGWTFISGIGHALSSIIIGSLGIVLGWSVAGMEDFEGIRGDLAAYGLLAFGGVYMLWGLYRGMKSKRHTHSHLHPDGSVHAHLHSHIDGSHADAHKHEHSQLTADNNMNASLSKSKSFWIVFIIFVLGPCEPLIPLLMVPAAAHSIAGIVSVSTVFTVATVGVMMLMVTLGYKGLKIVKFGFLEKYIHALSGAAILISGLCIQVLGL